uniref:Uncharacterized protein n=1 Tax=Rhizophora mucronata TaxID=61149 RepID=A0A2P2N154_RHIMU
MYSISFYLESNLRIETWLKFLDCDLKVTNSDLETAPL